MLGDPSHTSSVFQSSETRLFYYHCMMASEIGQPYMHWKWYGGLLSSSIIGLKELNIRGSYTIPLSCEDAELIICGLHHNTILLSLGMAHSKFSFQNTISITSVLRTSHILDLNDCNINSDGACPLAFTLCINDTLLMLLLECNPIGDKGATAFAEMLLKIKSLKMLNSQS